MVMNLEYYDTEQLIATLSQALTLNERLALFQNLQTTKRGGTPTKLTKWRNAAAFADSADGISRYARHLSLDEEGLAHLLELDPAELIANSKALPGWMQGILAAFARPYESSPLSKHIADAREQSNNHLVHFLDWLMPLIDAAYNTVLQQFEQLQHHAPMAFDSEKLALHLLDEKLAHILQLILIRTLTLELHVARINNELRDGSPEERFMAFAMQLQTLEKSQSLIQEYPVLIRQIWIVLDQWQSTSVEFVQRLLQDWQELRQIFHLDASDTLAQVSFGAGDTHEQGRSVGILTFSSGTKLVYKPRSLVVDCHFQALLDWVNTQNLELSFRTLEILDRDTYGWSEFIAHSVCATEQDLHHYYRHLGGFLGILHILNATDFHFENLIAAGKDLILIDLEALFHTSVVYMDITLDPMVRLHQTMLASSVLRIGLLPSQRILENGEKVIDWSGLGAREGQLLPGLTPHLEAVGTDNMHYSRQQMTLTDLQNHPYQQQDTFDLLDYKADIIAGFETVYRLFQSNKDQLLQANSLIQQFANDRIRNVLRATRTYGTLLHESFHPNLLRDALDRDLFFSRLWQATDVQPYLAQAFPAELRDLQEGNIPVFTTRPDSRSIWTGHGEEIHDFFTVSGLQIVLDRINNLSDGDLHRQVWMIDASLNTTLSVAEAVKRNYKTTSKPLDIPENVVLNTVAQTILDRILDLSYVDAEERNWFTINPVMNKQLAIAPVGIWLYDGMVGIALVFAYYAALNKEKKYEIVARSLLETILKSLETSDDDLPIGMFNGVAGVVYLLVHLAELWDEPDLLLKALDMVEIVRANIDSDTEYDIIGGAAGVIGALLCLRQYRPHPLVDSTLRAYADSLMTNSQIALKQSGSEQALLAGFSHGAAGMAWALFKVAKLFDMPQYAKQAKDLILYENSLFSERDQNWMDLRGDIIDLQHRDQDDNLWAWCHGAPGIGMSRLNNLLDTQLVVNEQDIRRAIESTIAHGFHGNHSLCHGSFGNLEFILQTSQQYDPSLQPFVASQTQRLLHELRTDGILSGTLMQSEIPGLMSGLAGIAYQCLRLTYPDQVPSILILASRWRVNDQLQVY